MENPLSREDGPHVAKVDEEGVAGRKTPHC